MSDKAVFDLLQEMGKGRIVLAYRGEFSSGLLDAVYAMMDSPVNGIKPGPDRKRLFQVLVESLQNVFHHTADAEADLPGFLIRQDGNSYTIITGNLVATADAERLRSKIDQVNRLTAAEMKEHYQDALNSSEFSDKGGAGLGIIEMARKSGKKLQYEFRQVNDKFTFFSLAVALP
jgi:hypothetical protein